MKIAAISDAEERRWIEAIGENTEMITMNKHRASRWAFIRPLAALRLLLANDALLARNQQMLSGLIIARQPGRR